MKQPTSQLERYTKTCAGWNMERYLEWMCRVTPNSGKASSICCLPLCLTNSSLVTSIFLTKLIKYELYTCAKSTLLHCVPLVNALKEAVPSSAPEGVPRNATQFTTMDPFVPSPDSNTQTRKLFCVTSVVHTTAES